MDKERCLKILTLKEKEYRENHSFPNLKEEIKVLSENVSNILKDIKAPTIERIIEHPEIFKIRNLVASTILKKPRSDNKEHETRNIISAAWDWTYELIKHNPNQVII